MATSGLGLGALKFLGGDIGGYLGSKVGKEVGYALDNTFNTHMFEPIGEIAGGFAGFGKGFNAFGKAGTNAAFRWSARTGKDIPNWFMRPEVRTSVGPINQHTFFADNQTPRYNPLQIGMGNRSIYQSPLTSQLDVVPQYGFASNIKYSIGNPTGSEIFATRYDGNPLQWSNINKDIQIGRDAAISYLSSPTKMQTDAYNKALAKRLFNLEINPLVNPADRASVSMIKNPNSTMKGSWHPGFNVKLMFKPNDTIKGETWLNYTDPSKDEVGLDLTSDLEDSAFHEWLHRGLMAGESDNITNAYYKWRAKQLIKPTYTGDYLTKPEEVAVNLLEIGRRNGIINEPYPGFQKAIERIREIINNDPNKGYLLNETVWETKPKRVWDALQGKYIGIIPIGTGLILSDNE